MAPIATLIMQQRRTLAVWNRIERLKNVPELSQDLYLFSDRISST